jgi:hypothetical protein
MPVPRSTEVVVRTEVRGKGEPISSTTGSTRTARLEDLRRQRAVASGWSISYRSSSRRRLGARAASTA